MITIPFVQGMVTVIAVAVIVGVFWAVTQIIRLKHQLENVYHQIDEVQTQLNVRMDVENREFHENFADMRSAMDSRFDKFETKLLQDYLSK